MASLTQKAIMQAFKELLETTPFDKITVSAITKRCEIHHNTFYYHYKDIYDLLEIWLGEVLGPFSREEMDGDWTNNAKAFLHTCREQRSIVYHIFNSLSRDQLERYVFTLADDVFRRYVNLQASGCNISEERVEDITKICRYAIFGYYLEFLWNGMEGDIDAGVDKVGELFAGIVRSAIQDAATK